MPIETLLAKVHEKSGATLSEWFGCLLPDRFTDFSVEYGRARRSVALIDKCYRAWFSLTGPDRTRYLNAILTNNIAGVAPGRAIPSLLLNPQGHILAEMEVWAGAQSLLCASYAMVREKLAATLDRYIIMDDVTLEDQTQDFGTIGIEGPKAADAFAQETGLALASLSEWEHREVKVAGVACRVLKRSPGGVPGAEFVADRLALAQLWGVLSARVQRHGGGPIGYSALSTLRLEQGVPWFGYDFDDTVLPHEARLESTHISFTKGCYMGQEIVERVRSRGHVNRLLVGLEFSGGVPPARGAKLFAEDKEVGHVTRAAFSPRVARPIGFGYLRREHSGPGARVNIEGGTATVIQLPIGNA